VYVYDMYVCMLKCTQLCMYTIRYTFYVTVCVMQGLCKHIRMHMQMRIHLCMQIRVYVHINVHVLYKHMYMLHMFTYTNSLHMRTCMRPGERLIERKVKAVAQTFLIRKQQLPQRVRNMTTVPIYATGKWRSGHVLPLPSPFQTHIT
jgi:hypothetical protein